MQIFPNKFLVFISLLALPVSWRSTLAACNVIDSNSVVAYHMKGPKLLVKTQWTVTDSDLPYTKYLKVLDLKKSKLEEVLDLEKMSRGKREATQDKYDELVTKLRATGYKFLELTPLEQKTSSETVDAKVSERVGADVPVLGYEVFAKARAIDTTSADIDLYAMTKNYKEVLLKKGIARVPLSSADTNRLGALYVVARGTYLIGLYENCSDHFWSLDIAEARKNIRAALKVAKPAPLKKSSKKL